MASNGDKQARIRSSITQRHGEQSVANVSDVQVEVPINVMETTTVLADGSLQLSSKCPLQSMYEHIPRENESQQVQCDLCAPTIRVSVSVHAVCEGSDKTQTW